MLKSIECDKQKGVEKGVWDSINLIDVKNDAQAKKTKYKITSTVVLEININLVAYSEKTGEVVLGGHLSKAVRYFSFKMNFVERRNS
jgi:hypothetical protein